MRTAERRMATASSELPVTVSATWKFRNADQVTKRHQVYSNVIKCTHRASVCALDSADTLAPCGQPAGRGGGAIVDAVVGELW